MNNVPQICVGIVKNTVDPDENGTFWVGLKGTDDVVPVNYVTPYTSLSVGGFVAIPEPGVEVLICKPLHQDEWYYMGASVARPENWADQDPGDSPVKQATRGAYDARGIPMRYGFRSPEGAGILIYEDDNGDLKAKKTVITSTDGGGKKIVIDDGPSDCITLESGNNSRIRIFRTGGMPGGIEYDSLGSQRFSVRGSNMSFIVGKDGDDLTIHNIANGASNSSETLDNGQPVFPAGNVNLQSKHKDVNVIAKEGSVYITSMNPEDGVIQIESRGDGLVLKTAGKVHIQAEEGIDMTTPANIAMQAGGSLGIQAGSIDMIGAGGVNIDGATVNLKPPGVNPVSPSELPEDNNQFPNGVPETN